MKSTNTLYEQQRAAFMRDDQYEDYVYKKLKENEWEEFAFLNENI